MFPGRLAEQPLVRQGWLWVPARSPGWQAGPAMQPDESGRWVWRIKGSQDIVNKSKAKHKGKHLLLKEEGEKERQK